MRTPTLTSACRRGRRGFALVEIVVVVVISAAIAIVGYNTVIARGTNRIHVGRLRTAP